MSYLDLPNLIRLTKIPGFDNRSNDVIYCRPNKRNPENPNICVFFGGDIQDFPENMFSHRDNKHYVEWSLENTAKLLQDRFLDSHIVVVRPLRMEYKTFSCFENFVPCTKCGVPEHVPTHNSLQHLESLIHNISLKIKTLTDDELNEKIKVANGTMPIPSTSQDSKKPKDAQTRNSLNLDDCDIILIGFSKGCVVLNQFLYEFNYYNDLQPPHDLKIISKLREMYWLDGGHSGGKNTWMTSAPLLESLAKLGIQVHVHVTPYQIDDERRPWIKKEERLFSDTLKKLGVPIQRTIHFQNIPAIIQNHFKVLTVFRTSSLNNIP